MTFKLLSRSNTINNNNNINNIKQVFDSRVNFNFFFFQSVAAAACFFYASAVGLYVQLGLLLGLAVIGTVSFVLVEWEVKRENREKTDSASVSGSSSASDS